MEEQAKSSVHLPVSDAAGARRKVRDSVLARAAEIGVQALIKLGSKGAQWLDLCPESEVLQSKVTV